MLLVVSVMPVSSQQSTDSTMSQEILTLQASDTAAIAQPGISTNRSVDNKTVPDAPPQDVTDATTSRKNKEVRRSFCGIGFTIGSRIIVPNEFNTLINELWTDMRSGYATSSVVGSQEVYTASTVSLKVPIFPFRALELQPNGQMLYAWKILMTTGAADKSASVFLADYSAGFDIYGHILPRKIFSLKFGGGVDYHWTSISVSGDEGEASMSGSGLGFKAGLGLNWTFSRVAIAIDILVPVTTIPLKVEKNNLKPRVSNSFSSNIYHLPKNAELTGFEIRPGIVIRF
jgi:hypothetical protein